MRLLACKPDTIDRAEDRQLFKDTMEKLNQPCIPSKVVEDLDSAMAFADVIGYPVIVRPAFTMGGTGGGICENPEKLHEIATNGLRLSHPSDPCGKVHRRLERDRIRSDA